MDGIIVVVRQWARMIAAVALMAGIIDMVLPAGSTRKTVRLVTGTMLLFVITAPLVAQVSGMHAITDWGASTLSGSGGRDAEQVAAQQLGTQLKVLLEKLPGVAEAQVVVTVGEGFQVQSVRAEVRRDDQRMVQPIMIVIGDREPEEDDDDLFADVYTAIALVTGLDHSQIDVVIVGR